MSSVINVDFSLWNSTKPWSMLNSLTYVTGDWSWGWKGFVVVNPNFFLLVQRHPHCVPVWVTWYQWTFLTDYIINEKVKCETMVNILSYLIFFMNILWKDYFLAKLVSDAEFKSLHPSTFTSLNKDKEILCRRKKEGITGQLLLEVVLCFRWL